MIMSGFTKVEMSFPVRLPPLTRSGMVKEDTVTMSTKELRRVHVLRQVREKRITQREAGTILAVDGSTDQAPAWAGERQRRPGTRPSGTGQPSNRQIAGPIRTRPSGCKTRSMGTSLRMTHLGHGLAYHRITQRPVRPAGSRPVPRRHRPVTQAMAHLGENGCCLHETSSSRRASPNRTFLCWYEADISKLG